HVPRRYGVANSTDGRVAVVISTLLLFPCCTPTPWLPRGGCRRIGRPRTARERGFRTADARKGETLRRCGIGRGADPPFRRAGERAGNGTGGRHSARSSLTPELRGVVQVAL